MAVTFVLNFIENANVTLRVSLCVAFREGATILAGYAIHCHGYFNSETERNNSREREKQLDICLHFAIRCSFLGINGEGGSERKVALSRENK